MSANLILTISQETAVAPYQFKITGINVYSFEEALYHVYHYWKQSIDDYASDQFIDWVGGALKLQFLAAKIKEIAPLSSLSRKMSLFLSLTDYFADAQIDALRKEIVQWENQGEWEKLKERGDYLMQQDDPEKAANYYKKALAYGENIPILNNLSISLMKSENYTEAIRYLSRALRHRPMDETLLLHLTEAHILNGDYNEATAVLESIEHRYGARAETVTVIRFFYGEISFMQGSYLNAIACYEKVIEASGGADSVYIYRLADSYVKLRFYDKALAVLDKVREKDKYFLKKQADVFVAYNNIP
ncbi:MAG: tetratricopeptide repeat protein, partial [Clostridiales bacterium]|nr:tetratricopeptide repeat protein [Clostridiales bacterium]